jgi:hypothetical protein
MIEMYVVLAFVLMLVPFCALYVFERLARAGKGRLAEPDRMIVLDGTIIPTPEPAPTPAPASAVALVDAAPTDPTEPIDGEACAAECRLVAALMAGDLSRTDYRERMADLAASDATIRPVRLPPASPGS